MNPKTVARRGAIKALALLESVDKPLGAILDDLHLPVEARPFAREIASGAVRHRARADGTLAPLLRKKIDKLDAPVRAALRLAAYERCALGTPSRAVADEYAEAMRAVRLVSAVAFVNAVARRLPDAWPLSPDKERDPLAFLTHEYSYPDWLAKRWLARLGFDECAALCRAGNEIAPLCLRVNTRKTTPETLVASLQSRGLAARLGTVSPDAVVVERAGASLAAPDQWPEWQAGHILAQDEAAQLVSRFAVACLIASKTQADANDGEKQTRIEKWTIIDACAAPGGKTTHLAQLLDDDARIVACDLAPGRLKLVAQNAARLGLTSIQARAGDFRQLAQAAQTSPDEISRSETSQVEALPDGDLVLLDAPCLGTGTLRRRPDAKWRKTPDQLAQLVALQRDLLDAAALVVKPGGVLAYATCSLEPEENEEQARAFLARHPLWQLVQIDNASSESETTSETTSGAASRELSRLQELSRFVGSDGFLRTLPHRDACDGAFAACFARRHSSSGEDSSR